MGKGFFGGFEGFGGGLGRALCGWKGGNGWEVRAGGLEGRAMGWCCCCCCGVVDRGTDGDRGMGRVATLAGVTGAAAEGGSVDDLHSIEL